MRRENDSPQTPIYDKGESRHGGRLYTCFSLFTQLPLQYTIHTNIKSRLNSKRSDLLSHVQVSLEVSRLKPLSERVCKRG